MSIPLSTRLPLLVAAKIILLGGCADPHNPLRCPCGRGVRSQYAQGVRAYESVVVVRIFLIGCAFLLLAVGCARTTSSETSNKKEQGSSPKATDSEEARCEGTGTYHLYNLSYRGGGEGPLRTGSEEDMKKAAKKARHDYKWGVKTHDFGVYTTNDLPGCPKGGLLLGTDKPDKLGGKDGDDEARGLGGRDAILGGLGE